MLIGWFRVLCSQARRARAGAQKAGNSYLLRPIVRTLSRIKIPPLLGAALFCWWCFGIAGLVLAVPILAAFKIFSAHIKPMERNFSAESCKVTVSVAHFENEASHSDALQFVCSLSSVVRDRRSRTVVDQFCKDIAINKGPGPSAVVGRSWFGSDDFVERFAFFFQRGNAIVNRYQHAAVFR